MKIAVDSRWLSRPTGVGVYLFELLRNILRKDSKHTFHLLTDREIDISNLDSGKYQIKRFRPSRFRPWTGIIKGYLKREKTDLYFTPVISFPRFRGLKVINTIHDFLWLTRKREYRRRDILHNKYWVNQTVKNQVTTILVSPHLKDIFKKNYPLIDPNSLKVLPNSCPDYSCYPDLNFEQLSSKWNIRKPYILNIGTTYPRKNQRNLIYSFSNSRYSMDFQLVIAGKINSYGRSLNTEFRKEIQDNRVIFTDYVNLSEVKTLYENCFLFAYPSLEEGFGIPILESQYFNKPVLTSDVSPLNWVSGKGAVLINPEDINSMASGLSRIIEDKDLRQRIVDDGRRNIERFSWEKNAVELLEIINSI